MGHLIINDYTMQFYDVKIKEKVDIADDKISKKIFNITTKTGKQMVRYAFVAETSDGRKLTKFASEADWKGSSAPDVTPAQ